MKDNNHIISLQETEELCHLYLDCRLSVLEERELEYLLTKVEYESELICEVRNLMGIEEVIAKKVDQHDNKRTHHSIPKFWYFLSIAGSFALLVGIGLSFFYSNSSKSTNDSYYIAYADGKRLNDKSAKRQAEAELQIADEFMRAMSEQEKREKEMFDNFTSINPFEE